MTYPVTGDTAASETCFQSSLGGGGRCCLGASRRRGYRLRSHRGIIRVHGPGGIEAEDGVWLESE